MINECCQVFHLLPEGIIRDIHFTENENAAIMPEGKSKDEAENLLVTLPLVKAGLITFEVMELSAFTGFDRIIRKSIT